MLKFLSNIGSTATMGNESSQPMDDAANAEDETVVPPSPSGTNLSNDVFDKIAGSQAQEEKSRRKSQLVESMLLNDEEENPGHDGEKTMSKKERRKKRHSNGDEQKPKSKKRKHRRSDDLEVLVVTQEQVETADAEPVTGQPAPSAPVDEPSSQSKKHRHKNKKASKVEIPATQEDDEAAQEWPVPSTPVEEPSSQLKKRKHKKSSQREVASSQEVAEHTDGLLDSQLAQMQPVEPANTPASQLAQKKRAKESKAADVEVASESHEDTEAADESGQETQGSPPKSTPLPAGTPAEQAPAPITGRRKRRLEVEDAADTPTKKTRKNMDAKKPEGKKPRKTTKTALSDASDERAPAIPIPKERAGFAKVINDCEWDLVAKEMKTHREMHNLSELEQIRLIHGPIRKNTQVYELFDTICDVLPGDRRRWGIIKAIRRKYHDFERRGEWLPEEDLELENLIKQHGTKWSVIAELMCRMPEDIRDRYRSKVACGPRQRLGKWSFAETLQFKTIVHKCQLDAQRNVRERAFALPEKKRAAALEDDPAIIRFIDWERVSIEMARARSVDQCRRKWAILNEKGESGNERWMAKLKRKKRYLTEASSMDLDDKLELLRALKCTGIQDEGNIPWKDIGGANIKANYKRSSRKMAWEWMKFTIGSKEALSLQYTLTNLIKELQSCNGDDPTRAAFEDYAKRLDYQQDVEKLQHAKKQPARRTKHTAVKVAAMTLREKLHLVHALKDSRIQREEEVDWNGILHDQRSMSMASKKKAWRLLKTTVETAPAKRKVKEEDESLLTEDEEAGPATVAKLGFQDTIDVLINRLESWNGQDQSKELFTAEAEALGLEAKVKDLERQKDGDIGGYSRNV